MSHMIKMYENLQDIIERELGEISRKGDIDEKSLDNLYKLTESGKNLDKMLMKEEQGDGSSFGDSYDRNGYSRRGDYRVPMSWDGMSNDQRMGEHSGARRGRDGDGDGRYNESRDYRESHDYQRSYDGHVSRDATKKRMVQKLSTLMDDTMSEKERQAIQECIEKIER